MPRMRSLPAPLARGPSRSRRPISVYLFGGLCAGLALVGCGGGGEAPQEAASPTPRPEASEPLPAPSEPAAADLAVAFLGDSLTAGFGLDEDDSYPALIERRLREQGYHLRVINGGVSGDTTAGGLRRLPWLLRQEPDILMVALGGNDGLRGIDPETSEANLLQILEQARAAEVKVLLAGMLIPPNYGADYTEAFAAIYPRLAEDHVDGYIPFLLEGVAGESELNQADGIHPTAEGQRRIAELVIRHLEPLLERAIETKAAEAPTDVLP